MAISNSCMLKEWAPLTDLLNKIPTKPNLSIFSGDVKITCVDILTEFIALGTNYGMAYWYDRKKKELQRLRCENSNVPITSIKVLSTVDYMLACGSRMGNISIFQIPKTHPDWIPENLKPKNKTVERYTVSDLHKAEITALEWSKNGMKLYSGDLNGTVVLTEIDFYMHICKSLEILNESYEVVQLSYSNPRLIVSTTYRSVICEKGDKWNILQIGQKDRKILGSFGGTIHEDRIKNKSAVIYCTRPGLRIWVADCQGNVQKTLLFKDLLSKDCDEVPLLNPISKHLQVGSREHNFGKIFQFGDNLLLTHNHSIVYILNPETMTVVSKISNLRRVLNVACHKDEIFILEEDRNLIRISAKPEISYEFINATPTESSFFPSSIRDLTSKLQPSNILSAIPPVIEQAFSYSINEHTDEELIVNAEEAMEVCNEKPRIQTSKSFESIIDEEPMDIIFKQKKSKKKHHNHDKDRLVSNSYSSNSSNEENIIRPTIMNLSTVGALPDLRSPQSIQNDIEYKEKILADILNFEPKPMSRTEPKPQINKKNNEPTKEQLEILNEAEPCEPQANQSKELVEKINHPPSEQDFDNFEGKPNLGLSKKVQSEQNFANIRDETMNPRIRKAVNFGREFKEKPEQNPVIKEQSSIKNDANNQKTGLSDSKSRKTEEKTPKGIPIKPRTTDSPACVNIPNEWNLSSVRLRSLSSGSSSLSDWEVV